MNKNKTFVSKKIGTRYFYKIKRTCYFIDDESKEGICQVYNKDLNYNWYEMQSGYEASIEGLKEYIKDFKKWTSFLNFRGINYLAYESHDQAIIKIFKSKTTIKMKELNFESPDYTEFKWAERCSNGGLISIDKDILNKETQCYGYDMNSWYPYLLAKSELQIPTKKGKEIFLEDLKFPLPYGYYNVIVNGKEFYDFYKIFAYSKDNVYTHYSLNFLNEINKNFKEEPISIKLLKQDNEPNAYIYDENTLIYTSEIFLPWYERVMELKKKAKNNKLIKRFSSSLWGSLVKFNRKFLTPEEFYDIDVSSMSDWSNETQYKTFNELYDDKGFLLRHEVIKTNEPYTYPLARLKSFLTSYSRMKIANLILDENILSKVIRIHTDGLVLTTKYDFSKCGYDIKEEAKTTGLLTWTSCNTNNIINEKRKEKKYKQSKNE